MEQFLSARFQSGRNANQKIGIAGVTTGKSLEVIGLVGIGTTIFNPVTDLDVRGSVNIRDSLTARTINVQNLNTGAGTSLSNTTISQLRVTGLSTFVGFSTFNDSVNIEDNLFVGGNVRILGVTTLAQNGGITTTGGDLYVGGDLYIADDLRFDEFTARNGNITGVGTIATLNSTTANITSANIVSGIVTTLSGTNLNYSGVGTITRLVSTAASFSQLQVAGVSTFTNGPVLIGSGTSTGNANQRLQVTGNVYVSESIGVGIATPRETLDVVGTIGVQASGATNRFEIQHNQALNSLDFIFV